MTQSVLIPMALAAFTVVVQPAEAASFPMTRAANDVRARDASVVVSEWKNAAAIPHPGSESSVGGAIYSPFAATGANATEPARQGIQTSWYRSGNGVGWTIDALAALAAVGALITLVFRPGRRH